MGEGLNLRSPVDEANVQKASEDDPLSPSLPLSFSLCKTRAPTVLHVRLTHAFRCWE
jgi:hypothetical protein